MKTPTWLAMLGLSLAAGSLSAQITIDSFEYATDDELLAVWQGSAGAVLSVSTNVAPTSSGTRSMRVDFSFASVEWATETMTGPTLDTPVAIGPDQYVTFRLRGDPAFAAADFRNLYLYVYDVNGDFKRRQTAVSILDEWQVVNLGGAWETPWNGSGNLDLGQIVRFAFFQYGSQAAIPPYTATIYIDDLSIRDTPLVELPPPSPPRPLIDDFEGYADDTALRSFYGYQNSWQPAMLTIASLTTPAPQGNRALKLAIDFAEGQYPWGSVLSATVPPFSFPTNATLTFQLKGDPALAPVADTGTTFWLSFFDKGANRMDFIADSSPVTSSDWTQFSVALTDINNSSVVDTGNLVQWRILVQGWETQHPALAAAFYIDDIRITVPAVERPVLSLVRDGASLRLDMQQLTAGSSYELLTTAALGQWSVATIIEATGTAVSTNIQPTQSTAFYQLRQKDSP